MSKYRVAFFGCGARSSSYVGPYAAAEDMEVAGLADPDPRQRTVLKEVCGLPGFRDLQVPPAPERHS